MVENKTDTKERFVSSFGKNLIFLAFILGVIWALEIFDTLGMFFKGRSIMDYDFGIRPRTLKGLGGIFLSPFLHGNFAHLIGNSIPFLVLGGLVMLGGFKRWLEVTFLITVLGGLGVWLFGAKYSVHIGASGVIFGYLGYLLFWGIFSRCWQWALVALVVGFFYGGLIHGVLPSDEGISWEAHLFGFLAGVFTAWTLPKKEEASPYTPAVR